MVLFAWFRTIIEALLCTGGLLNLVQAFRRRTAPAELRGCLLSAGSCLLLALALWAHGAGWFLAALVALGLGSGCALAWFYHIYQQSLQNTTM